MKSREEIALRTRSKNRDRSMYSISQGYRKGTGQGVEMELATKLSENIASTTFDDLPEEAVIAAKQSILDSIGVMLAATGAGEGVDNVVALLDDMGGNETCTVMANDKKSNPVFAVMANGSFAHSIDFDDVHDDAFVHPSGSVVPTALTLGEYKHISGKDLITAVALGNDLICRMGYAVSSPSEEEKNEIADLWMLPLLLGTFSSAATASKVLGLDAEQTKAALSIASNRASGSKQVVSEAGSLRGLYCMFPNVTGTLSALLASKGVPGFEEPMNGACGFFKMAFGNVYDESRFDTLGKEFEGSGVSIKVWPCCRLTNSYVNAALNIAEKYDIDPEEVEKFTIFYSGSPEVKRCIEPWEDKINPPTIPGAKISLPFVVGMALLQRKINIASFTLDSIKDPKLLEMASKAEIDIDETLVSDVSKTMLPGRVRVQMKNGDVYDERVEVVLGHPKNRLNWDQLNEKFLDCASYAKRKFTKDELMEISKTVEDLENLEDAADLMKLLA